MGDLIYLDDRRPDRWRPGPDRAAAFFFDLSCPLSYLTAERVERALGEVQWVPVAAASLRSSEELGDIEAIRGHAEARARALRLPLVWPERFPADVTCALRAAARACELGFGAGFALAASRLIFCGGFDLEDPETLAEAAAAAGLPLDECLAAAGDATRDTQLLATADRLRARGVSRLPAFHVGRRWLEGESGLMAAAPAAGPGAGSAAPSPARTARAYSRPLAPVG
jgi:2-hydroxychromene-2-carboxylate isomerase